MSTPSRRSRWLGTSGARRSRWAAFAWITFVAAIVVVRPAFASPSGPDGPSAAPVAQLPFEKLTLPNGLRVILHEDHRTPQVAVNV